MAVDGGNHDLEKLITKALVWSVKNIEQLYQPYSQTKDQDTILKDVTKQLIEQIETAKGFQSEENKLLIQKIDGLSGSKIVVDDFFNEIDILPEINPELPYPTFFKRKFVENFQLCFGELLKKDDQKDALIAYNRNVLTHIQTSIESQQETLVNELKQTKTELKKVILAVSDRRKRVVQSKQLDPSILIEWEGFTNELTTKVDLLVDGQGQILRDIHVVGYKVDLLGGLVDSIRRRSWQANLAYVVATLTIVALGYLVYYYFESQRPIMLTVMVENTSSNTSLPYKGAKIQLIYEDKIEVQEVMQEATFKNLPNRIKKDSIRVKATSFGFKTTDTIFEYDKNILSLQLQRNDYYKTVQGIVKDGDGVPLPGAKVVVGVQEMEANNQGRFYFEFAEKDQRETFRVTVTKEGYQRWSYDQSVIKNSEIRPILNALE